MKQSEAKISLARMYYPVKSLGPGNRVGIWVTGCNRRCFRCISPELLKYDSSKEVPISGIMQMVQSIEGPIDGFTISGGEPFLKPSGLNELVQAIATVNDDILIYTGYKIEQLIAKNDYDINSVLSTCAVLIDGPYIERLNDSKGLRGSSNQRCFIFKHNDKYEGIETSDRILQNIVYGNKVLTIGIPKKEMTL